MVSFCVFCFSCILFFLFSIFSSFLSNDLSFSPPPLLQLTARFSTESDSWLTMCPFFFFFVLLFFINLSQFCDPDAALTTFSFFFFLLWSRMTTNCELALPKKKKKGADQCGQFSCRCFRSLKGTVLTQEPMSPVILMPFFFCGLFFCKRAFT